MKTSKFTEEQIAYALRQVEGGTSVGEVCRRLASLRARHHPFVAATCSPTATSKR